MTKKCKACYTIVTEKSKADFTIQGGNVMNIHDFFEAALPWIAIAVALAVAVSFSKDAKKEHEREK